MELYFWLKSCPTLSLFLNFVVRMTAKERIWVSLGTHTHLDFLFWRTWILLHSSTGGGNWKPLSLIMKPFLRLFFFFLPPMTFFRTAALRESQQVALDSELLDTMPKQYVNREEQATLHLECRGSSGKKCQGAAVVTVQVRLFKFFCNSENFTWDPNNWCTFEKDWKNLCSKRSKSQNID